MFPLIDKFLLSLQILMLKLELKSNKDLFLLCFFDCSAVWKPMDHPQPAVCVSDLPGSLPGLPDHPAALPPQSAALHSCRSHWPGKGLRLKTFRDVGTCWSECLSTVTGLQSCPVSQSLCALKPEQVQINKAFKIVRWCWSLERLRFDAGVSDRFRRGGVLKNQTLVFVLNFPFKLLIHFQVSEK